MKAPLVDSSCVLCILNGEEDGVAGTNQEDKDNGVGEETDTPLTTLHSGGGGEWGERSYGLIKINNAQ